MTKRAIPKVTNQDVGSRAFADAVKENLETIMGHRGSPIKRMTGNESLVDVIKKVNEIIDRLQ